ncbi:MAG TPA: TonB C-terminal domain-containing protein [Desulfuromonadales bacterium]|nr:TonB C-terminal domain-containing protein [Desulfuromonadales bacterium]
MSHHHTDRQLAGYHHDPRFGRLLLASLGVHLAAVLLFSGVLFPRFQRDLRPVYHVDLVNLPVMNPQAGRPDARPPKPQAKAAAPEPVKASPPAPPKPKAKPEAVKLAKPEAAKPAAVKPKKPEAAQVKASEKPSAADEKALQEKLRQMQARQQIDDMKRRLDEMAAKDTRQAAISGAPAGMMDGKGTEAGSSYDAWLHEYLKQAWTLSRYQVSRRDLKATVKLAFDAQGNLLDYNFIKKSGEERFDDSVRKAVLQLKKLPNPPGSRMEKDIVFNLKDLLE